MNKDKNPLILWQVLWAIALVASLGFACAWYIERDTISYLRDKDRVHTEMWRDQVTKTVEQDIVIDSLKQLLNRRDTLPMFNTNPIGDVIDRLDPAHGIMYKSNKDTTH